MVKDSKEFLPENAVIVNAGTFVGSTYSQMVGISVTDNDLTLEFVFVNPRNNKEGQVVSRVTLPINAGLGLADAIQRTINEHIKKKRKTQ
ncbi:MAG: hypothetical protein A3C22_02995 [Candidatus Levybacteria bacterium RIFCSPHIGHO2_02_FULL_37_10]|nr:MAG: hypothetical protein A3C22_02995 [Candidatus Levybacteria bacterium RIFCSPHIGHO2_02_FULL_37_10]